VHFPDTQNHSNNAGLRVVNPFTTALVCAAALCALTACGGGGGGEDTAAPGTPTNPTTPAPVTEASCSEEGNLLNVAGTTAQIDANVYYTDGTTIIATQQRKFVTSGGASFRGRTGLHLVNQVNTTTYSNAAVNGSFGGSVMTTTENNYSAVVGDSRQTYGLTISNLFQGNTTTASSYFTPYAYTGGPVSPALNTPYVASFSTTTESGGTTQPALAQTNTTTYSVETITVLAGTFPACKIKVEVTGGTVTGEVSYAWLVASGRYKGLFLRSANGNGVKTSEATRLVVNGQ
jgi:hypothetical protein